MRAQKRTGLGILGGAAIAICLPGTALAQDSELVGTWNCAGKAEDPEMGMTTIVEFVQTYAADKTYERKADLAITIAAFSIDVAMVVSDSGTWRREGMAVMEIMSDIEITAASEAPSQAEAAMLQLIQQEAEADIAVEETMQIRSLTASTMEIDDGGELLLACEKE
jgi:hypothetical protein